MMLTTRNSLKVFKLSMYKPLLFSSEEGSGGLEERYRRDDLWQSEWEICRQTKRISWIWIEEWEC